MPLLLVPLLLAGLVLLWLVLPRLVLPRLDGTGPALLAAGLRAAGGPLTGLCAALLGAGAVRQPLGTYTETGWEVFPKGLVDLLIWAKERYGNIPTYITENGAAFFDPPVAENDRIRDPLRTDYLHKHLRAIHAAIDAGCDIRGYMVWSLLDNMEWSLGYSKRFGIVHVNYATQQRTPKDSARWYSDVIASHGRTLSDPVPG